MVEECGPSKARTSELRCVYEANAREQRSGIGLAPRSNAEVAIREQAEGFSGAEIEQAIVSAMYEAFDDDRDINTDDVVQAMKDTVPLSVTMAEDLTRLRTWAAARARPASD